MSLPSAWSSESVTFARKASRALGSFNERRCSRPKRAKERRVSVSEVMTSNAAFPVSLQNPERVIAVNETEETRITHLLRICPHHPAYRRGDFVAVLKNEKLRRLGKKPVDLIAVLA